MSAGSLETPKEWTIQPVVKMADQLTSQHIGKLKLSTVVYDDLDHMDVGLLSCIRGLEKIYAKPVH